MEPGMSTSAEPASNPTGRVVRADARRNRGRVVEAAQQLIAEHGMAATMRDIAQAAGVGLGTVYRHFPTKESLYEAIAQQRVHRLLDLAREGLAAADAGLAFRNFFTVTIAESVGEKALIDALDRAGLDPKAGTGGLYRELEGLTAELLARAQAAGAIRPEVGIDEVIALIVSCCVAADRQRWSPELIQRVLDVLFEGMIAG